MRFAPTQFAFLPVIAETGFDPATDPGRTWLIGLAANGVIAVTFLGVAVLLAFNLTRSRQWQSNLLGAATFLLFLACGGGHLVRFIQLLYPSLGLTIPAGAAIRYEYTGWHAWVFDLFTAAAGVSYWIVRRRFADLVGGAAVYEDLRERQRRALKIHDEVVQGLANAKLALDLDREAEGYTAVGETLTASHRIISDLLGPQEIHAGSLRRRTPVEPAGGERHGGV